MADLDSEIRHHLDGYEQGDPFIAHDDAIRAVLDLHPPEPLSAGVLAERFGEGHCAFCHLGEPLRVYEGELHYRPGEKLTMHDHANPVPWCETCNGDDADSSQPWPCPTVLAIARALGVIRE
ncbi:MAG TPA: hypothetical protein VHX38_02265 [Pseudonocardiaceae bacterium]|nr:hypothetical protein [Pseudonocardiaceae bacterium]